MKKRIHEVQYDIHESFQELTQNEVELITQAREATKLSYAPYSSFYVGAAVRFEDGTMLQGSNQENASYPLCNCAEQVVLNYAAMQKAGKTVTSMAVAVDSELLGEDPISPCGACRQIILEYEDRQKHDIKIYLVSKTDKVIVFDSIKGLLPFHFQFFT